MEQLLIYGAAFTLSFFILMIYMRKMKTESRTVAAKIKKAKEEGMHEPISLHPVINPKTCIKSGACVTACPEKDILGILDGRGVLINASSCVGHGACFHACPVEAITLVIGTDKRGVSLPHVNDNFETNVPGIYIAGELGGMGLIKNSVEQGNAAVENIKHSASDENNSIYDLIIVGAGPAGISASLTAKKRKLNFLTFEQDTLGGTVFTFPRSKIVMTAPMDLPLHGKVKLYNTSKTELLELWQTVIAKNGISIKENTKVESISPEGDHFVVKTKKNEEYKTKNVLLAIGRRGSPRKLNIEGETLEKVAYRLLEPELISGKNVMVVGGGDSAIEAALSLADRNNVVLSYRKNSFNRIKPKNREKINAAIARKAIDVQYMTNLTKIENDTVTLVRDDGEVFTLDNDLTYIFAGGELPTQFLKRTGVKITERFGYTVKKHR